ncbi:putative chromosome-partitioning protein ParB [bacterium BMS3Bbin11]|nr:putative chromosome-partitioning protein ParB [bacterium BMS3Abin11]GBE45699.1 putative chromosome-partitioning protein ParB [bacterium BMS3Bbin11]GMT39611.1 MAG: chromosome partitioning protein [bacterium]HDH15564.1 ParB/RepB/Spo0J family partition protein [Gammaproteobacteria bacterium]HDZ78576.1 ParB/RepB/Spo0J family partition protein [Gammaproteobacteria bacterium]
MNTKKSRLGRGLDALLGDSGASVDDISPDKLQQLPVEFLQRGQFQQRRQMDQDALDELANSIARQGVLQPIVARKLASGDYEIIAGERRWRAAQQAGLGRVPVVVRELSDEDAMVIGLIENLQREDLNPIEEARGMQRLIEEFTMTHQQVADSVSRSRVAVSNLLRLLSLQSDVSTLLEQGQLDMGHARALLSLEEGLQYKAAQQIVKSGMSVRQAEQLVRRLQEDRNSLAGKAKVKDPDVRHLEESLSEKLGTHVEIKLGSRGKGKLIIDFHGNDVLQGILEKIH